MLGVISAILTPTMVHGLGNMYYGMWALAGSLVDYSGLLDMGMRTALFRYVAYFRGAKQRDAQNQTFVSGLAICTGLMIVSFLVFGILAFILPSFFRFTGHDRTAFFWVAMLMGWAVSVALPGQFLSAYLRGLERFDLYNLGLIVHGILRASLLIALIKLGHSVVAVTFGVFVMSVFFLIFHAVLVKWADRELKISWKNLQWERTKEMVQFGFYSFVNNSGETLRYSTDSFVIGRMLNVALVTPFSIATRLIEYFRSLSAGISGPVMVRFSELSGKGREDRLQEEFLRSTRFCMLFSVFVGGLLLVDGQSLIQLWLGPNFKSSYHILVVLTVGYIAMFGQVPCQLLIFARAKYHRSLSWLTLAEGAANLGLSIMWARKYGIVGVAMGTAVPLLISKLLAQPWFAMKDIGLSPWDYFGKGLALPTISGCFFVAGSWLLVSNTEITATFHGLVLACILQGLMFAAIAYLLGLTGSDRDAIKSYGRRLTASFGIGKVS